MGRLKRGGYIIEWWMGDHYPKHVHIFKDGREIAKVQVPGMIVLTGKLTKKIRQLLAKLVKEKTI